MEKIIDVMLGIRTRGRRMVGADETTELWRPTHIIVHIILLLTYQNDDFKFNLVMLKYYLWHRILVPLLAVVAKTAVGFSFCLGHSDAAAGCKLHTYTLLQLLACHVSPTTLTYLVWPDLTQFRHFGIFLLLGIFWKLTDI